MLDYRILGPLEVIAGGQAVDLGSHKQRAVLALLLIHLNREVSVDRVATELWTDRLPQNPHHTVHNYISGLRKALGSDRRSARSGQCIVKGRHGYALVTDGNHLDSKRFEELLAAARSARDRGDVWHAVELFDQSEAQWRGDCLAEFVGEEFARHEIRRLEELRLSGIEMRVGVELMVGGHEGVVAELIELAGRYPLREGLVGLLAVALYRCRRRPDAIRLLTKLRHDLVDEFGIEPCRDVEDLELRILNRDVDLDDPARGIWGVEAKETARCRCR